MNRRVLLVLDVAILGSFASLLAACASHATGVAADAPAACYVAAVPSVDPPVTGVEWLCTNPETDPTCWDDLANRVVPALIDRALAGERSRQACAGFIYDLKRRGVLTQ